MTRSDDQASGRLGATGPIAHRRLAPRRLGRHPRRGLALAAAVRMVARVHDDAADLQAVRQEHVPLLAVAVEEQADPRGAVRVVLDRRQTGRHAELVALEVDPAVMLLLAAAAVADSEPPGVVPAGAADLLLEQRLVRLVGRGLLEGGAGHLAEARRGGHVRKKRPR